MIAHDRLHVGTRETDDDLGAERWYFSQGHQLVAVGADRTFVVVARRSGRGCRLLDQPAEYRTRRGQHRVGKMLQIGHLYYALPTSVVIVFDRVCDLARQVIFVQARKHPEFLAVVHLGEQRLFGCFIEDDHIAFAERH